MGKLSSSFSICRWLFVPFLLRCICFWPFGCSLFNFGSLSLTVLLFLVCFFVLLTCVVVFSSWTWTSWTTSSWMSSFEFVACSDLTLRLFLLVCLTSVWALLQQVEFLVRWSSLTFEKHLLKIWETCILCLGMIRIFCKTCSCICHCTV